MVKVILRVLPVLILGAWIGGIWYSGKAIEEHVRGMIRDDPSNFVQVTFDPFAEPEIEPLLLDRVWLSLVDYRRRFFASTVRLELNLRFDPDEEPTSIPLLAKFHHGPLIFAGGLAVGAGRAQITLDFPERRQLPPRWGFAARPFEGLTVTRGVFGFDGGFQGQSWLQEIAVENSTAAIELERMQFFIATDGAMANISIEGSVDDLTLGYANDALTIASADLSLRANNLLEKERYEGLMEVKWRDAALDFQNLERHVDSMTLDTEYRLDRRKLDAEISLVADRLSTAAEKSKDREILLDYGETVAAVGQLPVERLVELWDSLRLWEPPIAALIGDVHGQPKQPLATEVLMKQVSSNVSAYASMKFGVDEQELLMRANAEFMGENEVEHLSQIGTVGELFDYLLADFTFHADGRLAKLPEVKRALAIGESMRMLEQDELGRSGSVHVRAGVVRVNGEAYSPEEFLQGFHDEPLWSVAKPPVGTGPATEN